MCQVFNLPSVHPQTSATISVPLLTGVGDCFPCSSSINDVEQDMEISRSTPGDLHLVGCSLSSSPGCQDKQSYTMVYSVSFCKMSATPASWFKMHKKHAPFRRCSRSFRPSPGVGPFDWMQEVLTAAFVEPLSSLKTTVLITV